MGLVEAEVRNEVFAEIHPPFPKQEAIVESNRCLFCFDAPCTNACPTHIDVPRFIKKIASGNMRGSALTILDANILGLSCSRVCPVDVLCEAACVLHRYNKKPIEIGRLQRHAMDHFYNAGAKLPVPALREHSPRIACVGAGPASLACAAELRQRGYAVTVFEAREWSGGLNTHGVADYKLRPADSLREVEFIQSLGVEVKTGMRIGELFSLEDLEREFAAVFVGVGLGPTEKMNLPGEDLHGVIDAVSYIGYYKLARRGPVGRRVVVIGGGNTAIDAAIAAKLLGAGEVYIAYRRGEPEMPAFAFEYEHAKKAGVQFIWQTAPVAIHGGDDGHVNAIECVRTRMGKPDASGRSRPENAEGTNFQVPCDMAIVALGQTKLTNLLSDRNITFASGCIVADTRSGQTANPRYFAGGDCVNGGHEVVDAVAEGKRAGAGIATWLENRNG